MLARYSSQLKLAIEYLLTQLLKSFVKNGATANGTGIRHNLL